MATVKLVEEVEATPEIKKIYDEVKKMFSDRAVLEELKTRI